MKNSEIIANEITTWSDARKHFITTLRRKEKQKGDVLWLNWGLKTPKSS